jgi:hypothetical protein
MGNGGFESGTTPWTLTSNGSRTLVSSAFPHAGTSGAHLCGATLCVDQAAQSVTIPSTLKNATLGFWYYTKTAKASSLVCSDKLQPQLQSATGATIAILASFCSSRPTNTWTYATYNLTSRLSPYRGKSLRIAFRGTTVGGALTDFYVDDVSLIVQ